MGTTCDPDIVDIFSGNTTYTSSTSVTEIIGILSDYLENKLLTDLRGKKFTLLADESTDQANRTQLSVFARWVGNGEVKESYMGLINVERTSSAALMDGIRVFCLGKGIELRNIRFVGLDGCNAMSGENKGLQKRKRHENPLSIYVNCRNHRLALCLVHMVKKETRS
ncbi:uncharacterized protein LOC132743670 [Ruditapes philippinarum]|uniref:uncharacterized protein LOC132743670 n=1 Tax=Ruditapes philippinarum TaxID=129788 RepID=UPI00295C26FE|nr:uncharacterized protein LOC132743670 [Ruditapes philippinarum]